MVTSEGSSRRRCLGWCAGPAPACPRASPRAWRAGYAATARRRYRKGLGALVRSVRGSKTGTSSSSLRAIQDLAQGLGQPMSRPFPLARKEQINVAPSVRDLNALKKPMAGAQFAARWPIEESVQALSAPRLHRSP